MFVTAHGRAQLATPLGAPLAAPLGATVVAAGGAGAGAALLSARRRGSVAPYVTSPQRSLAL